VPELTLDDDERDAFAGHLDGVGVAQLVRGEASARGRPGGGASQLGACTAGGPRASACASIDDAEQWTDRRSDARNRPRFELLPAPVVHPDLAASSSFAATDED
jgi:hypothetical protein